MRASVIGLQRVGDGDAALAVQAGRLGERRVRADARGHHDEIGRHLGAVLEAHRLARGRAVVADQRLGLRADQEVQAAVDQRLAQQAAGHVVELALHQPRRDVHHGHLHAAQHQAVGRLEAQQAAADHDRVPVLRGGVDHGLGVGDVAVADHALQVLAGHRQDEGRRAGGDQQAVVGRLRAVGRVHDAPDAVDARDRLAQVQRDAVVRVPGERVEHDLGESSARPRAPATAGCGCSWDAAPRRTR